MSLFVISRLACQAVAHVSGFPCSLSSGVNLVPIVFAGSFWSYILLTSTRTDFLWLLEAKGWFILKGLTKPSEMMNSRGFSPSSFFSEEVCLSDEVCLHIQYLIRELQNYGSTICWCTLCNCHLHLQKNIVHAFACYVIDYTLFLTSLICRNRLV